MKRKPWAAAPPSHLALAASPSPAHSLRLLQGLRLLTPLPHWPFLGLLHSQQFKLCLHLPLEKGGTEAELLVAHAWLHAHWVPDLATLTVSR